MRTRPGTAGAALRRAPVIAVLLAAACPAAAQQAPYDSGDGRVTVDFSVIEQDPAAAPRLRVQTPGDRARLLMPGVKAPGSQLHVKATGAAAPAPRRPSAPSPAPVTAPPSPPPAPVAAAPAAPPPGPATALAPKPMAKPKPKPEPAPAPKPIAKPAPKPAAKPPAPPAAKPAPPPEAPPPPVVAATESAAAKPPPPAPAPAPAPQPVPKVVIQDPPPPPPPAITAKPPMASAPVAPPRQTAAIPPPATLEPGRAVRLEFAPDATKLPSPSRDRLASLAKRLADQKDLRLQLLAYAGGEGLSASKARRLSLSRALAVRSFLIESGLRSTRIDVRALGNKTTEEPMNRVDVDVVER